MTLHVLESLWRRLTFERIPAPAGKRAVIRLGFSIVLGLLFLSTYESHRIQRSQSEEALEIYRRHVHQDNLIYQLRRTIWLGAGVARDFLLNPYPDRLVRYQTQLSELRATSLSLKADLQRSAFGTRPSSQLHERIQSFWKVLEDLPATSAELTPEEKYEFVQSQIVPRRNAAGEVIREFSEITQKALGDSEADFLDNRRDAARRLFTVLAICGLLGLAVAWLSLSHADMLERQAQKQYLAVESGRAELRQLAARLMAVQEQERTRLSRELHDEIGQALATLRLEIVRAEPLCRKTLPAVMERLTRAREMAERSVHTVRNMCALLRPSLLDDLGLDAALQWMVEDFTVRTGIECSTTVSGSAVTLPESANTCVFRVIQEALHNCEKHSGASTVTVSLRWEPMLLEAEISDDGCGFDAAARSIGCQHLGILGMKERAAALGGTLTVVSSHEGTRISLAIPLEKTQAPLLVAQSQSVATA